LRARARMAACSLLMNGGIQFHSNMPSNLRAFRAIGARLRKFHSGAREV
jgi:hypothetical protein